MTELANGLDIKVKELAEALDGLNRHGMAAIFGICGRALAPLLDQVEQRSRETWTVPDLALALDLIEAFATGSAEAADHSELRARLDLVDSDDEHPWSTYVQDVLICVDAGLAAASADDRPKGILIHFALEPLMAVMQDRDADSIRIYGNRYWRREIIKDPAMAAALGFLHRSIAKVSQAASIDSREFGELVSEAAVLRPADP
jgi:hypothetical protein